MASRVILKYGCIVTASATFSGRGTVTVSPDGKEWSYQLNAPLPDSDLYNETFTLTITHPNGTTETRTMNLSVQNLGGYVYILNGNQSTRNNCDDPLKITISSVVPRIATIAATGEGDISYSITSGNDDNIFAIDATTGVITLTGTLDYETATSRTLEITATDGGNSDTNTNKNTATITINVENRNDNVPVFVFDGNGVYNEVTIPETVAPGTVLKWIRATDADGDRLTYTLNTRTEHYDMDPDTGRITVKEGRGLDFDRGSTLQIPQFSVSDGTNTIHSSVRVRLVNTDDEPSEFRGAVSGFEDATLLTGTAPTGGTSTGYRIDLYDRDQLGWSDHDIQIQNNEDRFEFRYVSDSLFGTRAIFELYLKAGETPQEGAINLEYRIYDGANYTEGDPQSITVNAINRTKFIADKGDQTIDIEENDADASVATVKAIGLGTVTYSITSGNSGGAFTIDRTTGKITLTKALDYETAPSHSLVITATDDGNSDTNTKTNTATITITINVQDINESPAFAPLQVDTTSGAIDGANLLVRGDDITAMLGSGITLFGTPTTGDDTLAGTTADEWIYGNDGVDTITSGGGNDHIVGGVGNDDITLSATAGNVETIYYRFSSSSSGAWAGSDGSDTINNFRRGEDRLILLDTDGTPIDLTTFLSADNLAGKGGDVEIEPIDPNNHIEAVKIEFADHTLTINYHADTYEEILKNNAYLPIVERYQGPLNSGAPANVANEHLTDNTLLPAYFSVADVLIPETFTGANGKFATVSATDGDNDAVRYSITGGTGMGIFIMDEFNGEISVSEGRTLDFDTTNQYTLEISATDNRDANGDTNPTIDAIQ